MPDECTHADAIRDVTPRMARLSKFIMGTDHRELFKVCLNLGLQIP
jgi:hypothetical protein